MIETEIQPTYLSDKVRVKTYLDTETQDLDYFIGEDIGVYIVRPNTRYNFGQGDLNKELGYINSNVQRHQEESAFGKYLTLQNQDYRFVSLTGYSQGDWADVIIYTPNDQESDLESVAECLKDWFRGDVYAMALEELHVYTEAETGRTIEQWEITDSVGAITLSKNYTLENAMNDYWDLSKVA